MSCGPGGWADCWRVPKCVSDWSFFLSPVLARREERRGIAHHLAVCPVCRQEYEDLRWVLQQASQGRLREPDAYPAPNLYFLRSGPSPEGADSTAGPARLAAGA